MEGPPLGPGGEDITWPNQVAPRGRKASSTRKIKPQTSNLFTVKWRLQLRCCSFAVVLAASWSAWFAWVPLRCCRWSFRRMLFLQLARPCRCWSVASWFVQV